MDNTFQSIRIVIQTLLLVLVPVHLSADENERFFQFGLMPPISSNGISSGKNVNVISLNLIGGYSAGNKIFELGSAWNANRIYTKGLQIAGLINYSGNSYNSVQISGLGNIAASGKSPLQVGGLFNIAENVNGVQLAGFLNIAKIVKGVQIGLINYMGDGEDGVSIGLLNIAKHGGKYEFEVSFSETLNTLLSYRLGTDRFYTIFSGGISYFFSSFEYAIGLGFGTSLNWSKSWSSQFEIQSFGVSYKKKIVNNSVNSIIQLRLPVCKEINKHFKVFVSPTLNVSLQDVQTIGKAKLSPWVMWKSKWSNLQVFGWVGLSAGIRF